MTTNPTPAELQAAYLAIKSFMHVDDEPYWHDIDILLAAVARDTLGWREVDFDEWLEHEGPKRDQSDENGDYKPDGSKYFIKDAAP